ncbi:molybdopterin cofactor-binding domain-containing protein [Lentzea flava]|uniref:molybdopterin cofactor-binding domain-containing protein n=1 Tax=Lentzea flava TaxID=103732 RepID=UPI003558AD90
MSGNRKTSAGTREVTLHRDGPATLRTAMHGTGTGTCTAMIQLAAHTLGLPMSSVTFLLGGSRLPAAMASVALGTVQRLGTSIVRTSPQTRDWAIAIAVARPCHLASAVRQVPGWFGLRRPSLPSGPSRCANTPEQRSSVCCGRSPGHRTRSSFHWLVNRRAGVRLPRGHPQRPRDVVCWSPILCRKVRVADAAGRHANRHVEWVCADDGYVDEVQHADRSPVVLSARHHRTDSTSPGATSCPPGSIFVRCRHRSCSTASQMPPWEVATRTLGTLFALRAVKRQGSEPPESHVKCGRSSRRPTSAPTMHARRLAVAMATRCCGTRTKSATATED